jgi:ankyrin repeat protein
MSIEEIEEWKQQLMRPNRPRLPQTLQIQALLIQHRICSEENPRQTSPSCLYLKSLLTHGNRLFDSGRYDHAINTYLLVLEQMTGFDPKMTHPKAIEDFNLTLRQLSSCFKKLLREPLTSPKREKLSPANIVMAIKFCTTIAKFFPKPKKSYSNSRNLSSFVGHTYDFLIILVDVYPQMNIQDKKQLEEHISSYINSNEKDTSTLLHAAIWPYQFNLKSINLFLRLGADRNATDMNGKTALHILASKWNWYDTKTNCTCKYFKPWWTQKVI